jgi:hypothetical protein
VCHAFWDDEHLTRQNVNRTIMKIDPHGAPQYNERLVGILVVASNEVAQEFHDLELAIVHFGDDLGLPLLVE